MHDSSKRLLDFAKEATAARSDGIQTFGDLARRMGVSSATMTNWKTRGVSKEGAIAAEALFGCSVQWVLTGSVVSSLANADEPALPPVDFADRREASESGWDVLQDLNDMPAREREALMTDIHARAENYRAFMRETIGRLRAPAAAPALKGTRYDTDASQPQEGGPVRGRSVWADLDELPPVAKGKA